MSLSKIQLERYADILIWGLETGRTQKYKPYDLMNVRYDIDALPLAEVLHKKLVQRKMIVVMRALSTPVVEKDFFTYSDRKQRTFIGRWEDSFMESINGNIFLSAPSSLTHLKDVDPKKINEVAITRKKLRKILEKREETGKFSWTLCTLPTEELAAQAGLSMKEYTNQIVKACYLNNASPVDKWNEIFKNSNEIKKWLNSLPIKKIILESDSCDLTISLGERRRFMGVSGHNIPSFEIFTSPDWRGTEGFFFANLPSFRSGNYVTSVKLEFKRGSVVKASAGKGNSFLNQMIKMDAGSGKIGEFSLTDRRFSRIDRFMADTLFDENFGGKYGNSHIAIGNSYTDTYSGNTSKLTSKMKKELGFNESALHWDLVNTEDKLVTAMLKNGKKLVIYENGQFNY